MPRRNCSPGSAGSPATVADTNSALGVPSREPTLSPAAVSVACAWAQRLAGEVGHRRRGRRPSTGRASPWRRARPACRRPGRRTRRCRSGRVAEHRLGDGRRRAGSPRAAPSPRRRSARRASGTVRGAGPVETTRATSVSGSTSPPARATGRPAPTTRSPSRRHASSICSVGGQGDEAAARRAPSRPRRRVRPARSGSVAELRALADDDEERLALGELARRPTGAVRMIAPASGCSSLRSVWTSMSQSKSAVCARAAASSRPTSSGTACVGTSNSCRRGAPSPASAASTSEGDQPRQPAPAPSARAVGSAAAGDRLRRLGGQRRGWRLGGRGRRLAGGRARRARRLVRSASPSYSTAAPSVRRGGGQRVGRPPVARRRPAATSAGVGGRGLLAASWRRVGAARPAQRRDGDRRVVRAGRAMPAGRVVGPAQPARVVVERRR